MFVQQYLYQQHSRLMMFSPKWDVSPARLTGTKDAVSKQTVSGEISSLGSCQGVTIPAGGCRKPQASMQTQHAEHSAAAAFKEVERFN